jgi:radical SAM-linked protein
LHYRLAVRFAIDGDLRFISHHDTLRLFERALARADIPMRFSEGFNPRPQLRIALPRPVGVASQDELLVVELTRDVEPEHVTAALSRQMPDGVTLRSAEKLADEDHRRPCAATYELPIAPDRVDALAQRINEFMASKHVVVQRQAPKTRHPKAVDIRLFIQEMRIAGGGLRWTQSIRQEGTVRVNELLEALNLPSRDHLHRVRRQTVAYDR